MNYKALLYARTAPGRPPIDWLQEDAQIAALRAYAKDHDLPVCRTYIEENEAAQEELRVRPAGVNLMAALVQAENEKPWTFHLLAPSSCRIWRTPSEGLAFLTDMISLTVAVHLVQEGVELNRGPSAFEADSGEAYLSFLRHQVEAASRLQHEHEQAAKRRDRRRSIRGAAPYGFSIRNGRARPEPDELRVLGRALELRQAGLSYRDLAAQLGGEGIRTRTGGRFTPTTLSTYVRRLQAEPDLRGRATAALEKSRRKRGAVAR